MRFLLFPFSNKYGRKNCLYEASIEKASFPPVLVEKILIVLSFEGGNWNAYDKLNQNLCSSNPTDLVTAARYTRMKAFLYMKQLIIINFQR